MTFALRVLAVLLPGILAGVYVGVVIGDRRIEDLDAGQYAAMHQARDRTFGKIMPILGFSVFSMLALRAALSTEGTEMFTFALGAVVELVDIAMAVIWQVPRNRAVQAWRGRAPPQAWRDVRDGWARSHRYRTLLGVAIFAMATVASLGQVR